MGAAWTKGYNGSSISSSPWIMKLLVSCTSAADVSWVVDCSCLRMTGFGSAFSISGSQFADGVGTSQQRIHNVMTKAVSKLCCRWVRVTVASGSKLGEPVLNCVGCQISRAQEINRMVWEQFIRQIKHGTNRNYPSADGGHRTRSGSRFWINCAMIRSS